MKRVFCLLLTFSTLFTPLVSLADSTALDDQEVLRLSMDVVFGSSVERSAALTALTAREDPDVAAALILAQRHRGNDFQTRQALHELTGQKLDTWHDSMLWQEAHPEIVPHPSFRDLKLRVLRSFDPEFLRFLGGSRAERSRMKIRLEEITWGGVRVDGIPSLDDPVLIDADQAGYMNDDDLVFGVHINGDARAYPLRIMGWHEMFNETIGGVPVALAYCTLCGSGILFETLVEGRAKPFVFGSSGLLYRSNKLMFDRETDSLWNQFTGRPVTGPLVGSGIELKIRPVVITSWLKWKTRHPTTRILSLETGHLRNYDSGVVYRDYFASPDLMFPAIVRDESKLKRKDYVFGVRDFGVAKAWPLRAFANRPVINDSIGGQNLVLIGEAASRSVRAYRRGTQTFEPAKNPSELRAGEVTWVIGENALTSATGQSLPRVPGHVAYWFAWDGYLGAKSELYDPAP